MSTIDYELHFGGERSDWTEKISNMSVRMRNIREIPEIQVELYSDRQKAIEKSYKIGQKIAKLNAQYRSEKKTKMEYYSVSSNVKYGSNEKTSLIEWDLSELKLSIDTFDNHMNFMKETIKTIDHFIYGIKSRIELETFMRGG